jgi:hypothetical protein
MSSTTLTIIGSASRPSWWNSVSASPLLSLTSTGVPRLMAALEHGTDGYEQVRALWTPQFWSTTNAA